MTPETLPPKWAMEAANNIGSRWALENVQAVARIIAAAAPDEGAIRRDEREKCRQIVLGSVPAPLPCNLKLEPIASILFHVAEKINSRKD